MSSEGLAALKINRSRTRRSVPPWVWAAGLAAVALVIVVPQLLGGMQTPTVSVVPAAVVYPEDGKKVADQLKAAGYIVADRQSVLAAKFTGRLAKLNVVESDPVKAGDVVAEIDHEELDATILQAEAAVAEAAAEVERYAKLASQADAELAAARAAVSTLTAENEQYVILQKDAQRRWELARNLVAKSAGTASEVDDRQTEVLSAAAKIAWTRQRSFEAEQRVVVVESQAAASRAAVESARARQKSAEANVEVLKSQRDECFILAPFDGVVTEKAAEVGEIVAPISIGGSMARGSIVTIADLDSLQAEVDVAESQIGNVRTGDRAQIKVDAFENEVPGSVLRILPRADRSKATVKVRVKFDQIDKSRLRPEMGVRVTIDIQRPEGVIVVPKAAVQSEGGKSFVWVVNGDKAERREVEPAGAQGEQIRIRGSVAEGDKVVVRGAEQLSGQQATVEVVE